MATEKKHVFNILSIDAKTVITDANPMPLVHSILYQRCTTGIGFASVITVLTSIKIQWNSQNFVRCIFQRSYKEYLHIRDEKFVTS